METILIICGTAALTTFINHLLNLRRVKNFNIVLKDLKKTILEINKTDPQEELNKVSEEIYKTVANIAKEEKEVELFFTEEQTKAVLRVASGMFLSEQLPEDWEFMNEFQQDEFIVDNTWEPLERHDSDTIWRWITDADDTITDLIKYQFYGRTKPKSSPFE